MRRLLLILLLLAAPAAGQIAPFPGAQTQCGKNGTWYTYRPDIPLTGVDSGRLRYGPCFGGNFAMAECSDVGGRCIVSEASRLEIQNKLTELQRCLGQPAVMPSQQLIYDLGLTRGTLDRLRREHAKCTTSAAPTCPPGQSCRGECPSCPVCAPCPPVPACGPIAASTGLPPTGQALFVWDTRTAPPTLRRTVWLGTTYLLQSGAELAPEKVSHWMLIPEIR